MPPIKIINAGAGSGKTYHLTEIVLNAVKNKSVHPAKILLTTFTNKAAAELKGRVTEKLLYEGFDEEAMMLRHARIGTVHGICSSLLDEYAFEAGLTVRHKVLPESEVKPLFDEALANSIPKSMNDEIRKLSNKFSIEDWRMAVEDIVAKARSNLILAEDLSAFSGKSIEILFHNIGETSSKKENLVREVEKSIASLTDAQAAASKPLITTRNAIYTLRDFIREIKNGDPKWSLYLRLANLKAGADNDSLIEDVRNISRMHYEWPEFKSELNQLLAFSFEAAKLTMEAYQSRKEELGYLDFVDLEQLGLSLLENPKISKALGQNLDLVMVDEFQDTSPIQLQLFLKLSELAKKSVWVGDPKQSVYEFRGADPELMFAVTKHLEREGEVGTLDTSYRSRPELVTFVNDLFKGIFPEQKIASENVILKAVRKEKMEAQALESWVFNDQAKTHEKRAVELANQIAVILKNPDQHPVIDKKTKLKRAIGPEDMAVLAQDHKHCNIIAEALKQIHIDVERETLGILKEPEVELALAGLKLMLRPHDTLSAARITFYHQVYLQSGSKDKWLTMRISEYQHQRTLSSSEDGKYGAWLKDPMLRGIRDAHDDLRRFSPSEALQMAMEATQAFTFAGACRSARKRIGNLEKLLNHARDYEKSHLDINGSATITGFLLYLNELEKKKRDTQATAGSGAVTVGTWHSSKGLEWNMVVLYGLDQDMRESFFGVSPASDEKLNLSEPLKGRLIHYFPNPYSGRTRKGDYFDRLHENESYKEKQLNAIQERVRLFYVLFTRARDYLVFTAQAGKTKTLAALQGGDSASFSIPQNPDDSLLGWQVVQLQTPVRDVSYVPTPDPWYTHSLSGAIKEKAYLSPSMLKIPMESGFRPSGAGAVSYGRRIPVHGNAPDNEVGNAVHLFLGIDKSRAGADTQKNILNRILQRMELSEVLPTDPVIEQSDAFEAKIQELWPGATCYREWPISFEAEDCILSGSIDYLLETEDGWIIIDHKTYHGSEKDAGKHALDYIPQMVAYAEAVTLASGKPVMGSYINFILLGFLQELKIKNQKEILKLALS